jgi:hypothetical protein
MSTVRALIFIVAAACSCNSAQRVVDEGLDAACTSSNECQTGCCATLYAGVQGLIEPRPGMVCAHRGYCSATCGASGQACAVTDDCCLPFYCSPLDGGTCQTSCFGSSECTTGCCAPLDGSDASVCSPPSYCQ